MTDDVTMKAGGDPGDYTVDQVNAYLETVTDDAERARVLGAEQDGQARKGILEGTHTAPTPEGEKPGPDTKAETFSEAAAKVQPVQGEKYEKGYDGYAPSRDGDHPVDLTLAGVTGQNDKDA